MCPLPPTKSWHGKRRREPLAAADCDTRPQCSVFSGDTILPDWTPKCAFLVRFAAGFESGPHLEAADTGTLAPARDGVARSSSQPCGVRGESHMEHITPRVSCLYVQTLHDHANRPIVRNARKEIQQMEMWQQFTPSTNRREHPSESPNTGVSGRGTRSPNYGHRRTGAAGHPNAIGVSLNTQTALLSVSMELINGGRRIASSRLLARFPRWRALHCREGRLHSGRGIGTNRHTKIKNNKPAT